MPNIKPSRRVNNNASKTIEQQISAFLKSGGQIIQVPYGQSGRPSIAELKKQGKEGVTLTKSITDWNQTPACSSINNTKSQQ
ncbi:hypothetical protein H0A36_26740 [Endozoicomonas sp. SM1973]|uniref:Transcriptional regulator SutA RNAP-binding domain-containing protein n=1 Tax=Spartinivicinus marinus TaxID=2994442 RepID=A0A853IJP7_9GAMM|nr:hypothetical protein [Spartinivicinus marinus]MCX4030242.1 hypothetical protein [Spartinivicinus marinus]MCX4030526.1 hypothetical protein [Spartinivicinus marinus]NYZ69617.1 hypothetical protein [Spartinivicinus marinus]